MNTLLNHDRDEDIEDMRARGNYGKDREITLGTTMLLGIFFALAVFGAVFFGFGYSMGAKHTMTVASAGEASGSATFANFKPAPGNPLAAANSAASKPAGETVAAPFLPNPVAVKPAPVKTPVAVPVQATAAPAPLPPAEAAHPAVKPAVVPASQPAVPMPASVAGGQFVVQVAAVSHQEDADLLQSTLKRRGYAVAVRSEPQDHLLHVQIGSYVTRKDADVMRQKLLADGFNAIVK